MTKMPSSRAGARAASLIVGATGLLVLIGWMFEVEALKSVVPGLSTMKANTALCLLLMATALWLATRQPTRRGVVVNRTVVVVAAMVAAISLFEYASGVDLSIDRLWFYDRDASPRAIPGRMSVVTAIAFLLVAAGIVFSRSKRATGRIAFVASITFGLIIAFLALSGYVYGVPLLYQPVPESSIAVHTAGAFLVLFLGVAALRPDIGWIALLRAETTTGAFFRWVLPAIVLMPPLVGWVILQGVEADRYDARDGLVFLTLACVTGLAAFAWGGGTFANRLGARAEEQSRVLRTVVETALDAFILMDAEGRIRDWNPQAERMFGYSREEALGRLVMETVIPVPERAAHQEGLKRFLETGEGPALRQRIEVTAMHRNGSAFPVELMILPVSHGHSWVFSAFVRDLSESKRAEAQLRQAQKMEAVGQLTGGVAHDFNNLLTVIIVSLDNALARVSGETRAQLENALYAGERGAVLIRELLAFSRRQTLSPEPLNLNTLSQGMLGMLNRLLGEHIEIDLNLAEQAWPAFADRSQVETALLNLALNARDAMPEGGKLAIETANVTLDDEYCRHNTEVDPGEYVMLAVSDSGVGMDASVLEQAFEPFFTTKDTGKGSGLGLSMIYGFAKQSRGHLKLYSELGHGTTVRLYLPRANADQRGAVSSLPQHDDDAVPAAMGGEVVLVVEDDAQVRAVAVAQFRQLGYRVLEAGSGSAAIQIIETDCRIDLLFTDVVMPGKMSGRQLAEAAARRRPALKTLFTSGYTDNSIVHHGHLDAGVHFLAKPYRVRELARKVRAVLDGPDQRDPGA